ncbi:MAG: integrase core domain-containing protein, partial [Acidimicrobiales bacterium]
VRSVETLRTPVRAPHANTFAERWVETVRADCLDHLLIFSHRQLRRGVRSTGVETIRNPVRSPRANAYAERFVRTIRQECLDHLLVVSRQHLESVLDKYVQHYNQARPHGGLHLEQPIRRSLRLPPIDDGTVTRLVILGGIIHEYGRAA